MKNINYYLFTILLSVLVFTGQSCAIGGSENKGPAGMFATPDKGETWSQINTVPNTAGNKNLAGVSVYKLEVDPQDHKALYWASREKGLFYTFDGGASWSQAGGQLSSGFVYGVAVHPAEKCTIYATNGRQLYKTADCSRSWEVVYTEVVSTDSIKDVAIDPFAPHGVYAILNSGNVLKSEDAGLNWRKLGNFSKGLAEIEFDSSREGLVYLASKKNGLLRSFDRGDTWENLNEKLDEYSGGLDFRRLYVYTGKANQIYWISKYGILFSKNAGDDWDILPLVSSPGTVSIYGFAVNPKNDQEIYYTATNSGFSTFYRSADGGNNWVSKKLPTQQLPTAMYVSPTNNLYLGFTIVPKE